jgi:hypothetical protein
MFQKVSPYKGFFSNSLKYKTNTKEPKNKRNKRNSVTNKIYHFENILYKGGSFQKFGLCYKTSAFWWGVTQNG